jgi:hypothetical protein
VTVEQRDGDGSNNAAAYINAGQNEFEIEYANKNMHPNRVPEVGERGNNYGNLPNKGYEGMGGYEDNDRINTGPTTLANGSVYTGERVNGKKHGRGVQVWPDSSRYEGMWEND